MSVPAPRTVLHPVKAEEPNASANSMSTNLLIMANPFSVTVNRKPATHESFETGSSLAIRRIGLKRTMTRRSVGGAPSLAWERRGIGLLQRQLGNLIQRGLVHDIDEPGIGEQQTALAGR